jgi:hypothetical protein
MAENDGRPPRRRRASRTDSSIIREEVVVYNLDGIGKALAVVPIARHRKAGGPA